MKTCVFALLFSMAAAVAMAQQAPTTMPDSVQVNAADVSTPDALIAALYNVISGNAGQKRNWPRFLGLFAPGARLVAHNPIKDGKFATRVLTPADYINLAGPRLEQGGFFEIEIARRSERFGNIMHVFTTYEGKQKPEDEKPFVRGINSIQLYNDGTRWYLLSVFWQPETPEHPLPAKYLQTVKE